MRAGPRQARLPARQACAGACVCFVLEGVGKVVHTPTAPILLLPCSQLAVHARLAVHGGKTYERGESGHLKEVGRPARAGGCARRHARAEWGPCCEQGNSNACQGV